MLQRKLMAAFIGLWMCAGSSNTHAFGLGDVVSMGLQVGGKLVGAAVDAGLDKAKDAMRDPEAEAAKAREEERQVAEQFQKDQASIEARHDLSPLQREQLSLTLKKLYEQRKQFQQFVEMAEARQRAERDKIFTGAGLLGVVGEAALNTPSATFAKADMMVKAGIPQAQSRAAIGQADALLAAGVPQAKSKIVMAQADALAKSGVQQAGTRAALEEADAMVKSGIPQAESKAGVLPGRKPAEIIELALPDGHGGDHPSAEAAEVPVTVVPQDSAKPNGDAFSPDLGRKIFVEFVGSPSETAKLRKLLASQGHLMVTTAGEAEITYLLEGQFGVAETRQYGEVTCDAGSLLENSAQAVPMPEKKVMGTVNLGISRFLLGMAAVQGQQVPKEMIPQEQTIFRQQVLLVAARQPKGGKETRVSVVAREETANIVGASLSKEARDTLYEKLGLNLAQVPGASAVSGIADGRS